MSIWNKREKMNLILHSEYKCGHILILMTFILWWSTPIMDISVYVECSSYIKASKCDFQLYL